MSGSDPAEGVAWIDGAFVPLPEARIPILDRGFVRSDATYDVAHVREGRFFRLDDHIDRFFESMAGLRMSLGLTRREIADILIECVRRSGLRDAYVQMTCTRGVPPQGSRDPRLCTNRFYAFAQPFVWIATPEIQAQGVSLVVSDIQRIPPEAVDPRIKNFHWLDLTMGIFDAYDRGALVSVLVDGNGNLTEGAGFNIFAVKGRVLVTPDRGVFEGMTRRTVLELAGPSGLDVRCRPLARAELDDADEIFITSTAGGVMPVTKLDNQPVGDGRPGARTCALSDAYWALHSNDDYIHAVYS